MYCSKCGEDMASCFFKKSATMCDDCWRLYDMDRFAEAEPQHGKILRALVVKLRDGSLGIKCPHCNYNVKRLRSYFHKRFQAERCPRCMERYTVRPEDGI